MGTLKIGAFLSSFCLDFVSAVKKAHELGMAGLELSSLPNEIDVEHLTPHQCDHILTVMGDHNLAISSVCGEIGGFAIDDEAEAMSRVERTQQVMEVTKRLGCDIVQLHIGVIPHDLHGPTVDVLRRALDRLGAFGQEIGVCIATETGPEPGDVMKRFLDTLQNPTIKVNYDPANLVMNGFDAIAGVYDLKDYIVHTHAKDGLRKPDASGEQEKPLGCGDVDFPRYIQALKEIGYDGFYIIERELGNDRVKDITDAVRFLQAF